MVLLAPNREHQSGFPEVPLVGFKKGKSLKDILVRAKVIKVENAVWYVNMLNTATHLSLSWIRALKVMW